MFLKLRKIIPIIMIIVLFPFNSFALNYERNLKNLAIDEKTFEKIDLEQGNWESFQPMYDIPLMKEWTIRFNKEVDFNKIDGIVIVKGNKFIPIELSIKGDNEILVNPVYRFEPNSKYTIRIFLSNQKRYCMDFYTTDIVYPEINFFEDNLIRIEADETKGFYAPYYLFVPKEANRNDNSYILVEPNNTGRVSDDPIVHEERARRLVERETPNKISRDLNIPLLVPCFVRPETDWRIYTHALDTDTMKIQDGYLKRIDLQLLNMVEDARKILSANGLDVNEKIFMSGFSASGNFTNRFVALHPEKVRAVASGGVNGMPIIPLEELDGYTLNYQVGIANLEELIGKPFNLEEYKKVAQYIYMGALDRNDTLPYRDAYGEEEAKLTEIVLGKDMMNHRWPKSQEIYEQVGVSAQMVTYEGTPHKVRPEMIDDIVEFFRVNGEIDEGIIEIDPYEYEYIEYKELEVVHIYDAKWGDYNKERPYDFIGDNRVGLFIEEWMEGQDHHQLSTFLNNLPKEDRNFTLKAEGHTDVQAYLNGWTFSPNPQGFVLEFSDEELEKIVPGVEYTLHPHRSSSKYYFVVRDGVVLKRDNNGED